MERKYLLSDLFEISTTKSIDKNKLELKPTGKYDFIGRTSVNNGIQGKLDKLDYEANPKNTFSLVQIGESIALWREREWYASQNIFILKPKMPEINDTFLYFQTLINKQMSKYGNAYNSYPTMKSLLVTKISVPVTKEDQIDWNYMKDYIAELEEERIAELEQYLIATGLNDYQLTEEDIRTLSLSQKRNNEESDYKNAGRIYKEFKLTEIWKIEYGNKFDKNKMTHKEPSINFVSRTALNNGISDFVDNNGTIPYPAGLITLALGGSIGSCFLQNYPFYTGQNVGVIDLGNINYRAKIYLTEALGFKCKKIFNAFGNEINKHLKTDLSVPLPICVDKNNTPVIDKNNKYHKNGYIPDWDYMEKYIRAIEKIVIADVVKYKDNQISITKQLVQNACL